LIGTIGCDPLAGITTMDWLCASSQALREITCGAVYHDGLETLTEARRRLEWYPEEMWRALMAAQWQRVAQEEAFVGRCGEVNDELGSTLVGGRLVRDLMLLCFLVERKYAPYSKWLGAAFAQLERSSQLVPTFAAAMHATNWKEREHHLNVAYEVIAELHNALGLTEPIEPRVATYFSRPFRVIRADRFVKALRETLPLSYLKIVAAIGSVAQFADSTDIKTRPDRMRRLGCIYSSEVVL
jgi:uncharacterized protein DUF4037